MAECIDEADGVTALCVGRKLEAVDTTVGLTSLFGRHFGKSMEIFSFNFDGDDKEDAFVNSLDLE